MLDGLNKERKEFEVSFANVFILRRSSLLILKSNFDF